VKQLTEKEWNETNRAVCLRLEYCPPYRPPIASLALFVFGAVVEDEATDHDSNLVDMGFDVEGVPLGFSVWEGTWAEEKDHEGGVVDTHAEGVFRRLTTEEMHDLERGLPLWVKAT